MLAEQGYLLRPDRERLLFDRAAVEVIDWSVVNIRKESQGPERDAGSIQHRAIQVLRDESTWDIVIDDDGPGELADVVFIRRDEDVLNVLFVDCKYSQEINPGARIGDLY